MLWPVDPVWKLTAVASSKSEMKVMIGHAALDPIEDHLGELLERTHILS
jgi:hypothetical protein